MIETKVCEYVCEIEQKRKIYSEKRGRRWIIINKKRKKKKRKKINKKKQTKEINKKYVGTYPLTNLSNQVQIKLTTHNGWATC